MGRSELQKLLEQKQTLKEQAIARHWPGLSKKTPLTLVFAPTREQHQSVLFQLLESFQVLPGQFVIVSQEDAPESGKSKIHWINSKNSPPQQLEKWLTAADMVLSFEEHQATLRRLFEHGAVPIAFAQSPLLENYNPNEETGNGFTFDAYNPWSIFMALVRAHETYRFPYDWHHIVRNMLKVR